MKTENKSVRAIVALLMGTVLLAQALFAWLSLPVAARATAGDYTFVAFYTREGERYVPYAQVEIPLGMSLGRAMPDDPPGRKDADFAGWSLAPNSAEINFDANTPVEQQSLAVFAVWRYTLTVEHRVYSGSVADSTLKETETLTALSAENLTVPVKQYPGCVFDEKNSTPMPMDITGSATILMYYRKGEYGLKVAPQVTVDVPDRSRTAKGGITLEELAELAGACTVNRETGEVLQQVGFDKLTSSDFAELDFHKVGKAGQKITLHATWANGDSDSQTTVVYIRDREPPDLVVANRKLTYPAGTAAMGDGQLLKAFAPSAYDNFDALLEVSLSCLGLDNTSQIAWSVPGEYVVYITATDSSGNSSRKACIVAIV